LLAKLLIVNLFLSVVGIGASGLFTYRVARDALQAEAIASGTKLVVNFAKTNTMEWLDDQAGPLNLKLRLKGLVDTDGARTIAAYVLDRNHRPLAAAGPVTVDDMAELPLPEDGRGVLVTVQPKAITIACEVVYDKIQLGYTVFRFNSSMIAEAGARIIYSSSFIILSFMLVIIVALTLLLRRVLRPVVDLGHAAQEFAKGNYSHRLKPQPAQDAISNAARSFNSMCDALELAMRFTNGALVERIKAGNPIDEVREHQLCVIFGDARGYTPWSRRHTPNEIFATLNRYYTCFGRVIVGRFNGIIDKFIGDGIMAYFGLQGGVAPQDKASQVRDALRACVHMQLLSRVLSHAMQTYEKAEPLTYRLGMATGRCLVGAIGAKDTMLDYSLIGNVVNLASRLEGKAPPGGLVVDRFTVIDAGEGYADVSDLGAQTVKGIDTPIQIFRVNSLSDPNDVEAMRAFLLEDVFEDAVLLEAIFGTAKPRFEQIAAMRIFIEKELGAWPRLAA
jgi:class 3 adenylate cyclase